MNKDKASRGTGLDVFRGYGQDSPPFWCFLVTNTLHVYLGMLKTCEKNSVTGKNNNQELKIPSSNAACPPFLLTSHLRAKPSFKFPIACARECVLPRRLILLHHLFHQYNSIQSPFECYIIPSNTELIPFRPMLFLLILFSPLLFPI